MAHGDRMTIDELARLAGCTTRSVRSHQTARLLPPPSMEGRVALYDGGHLARLRLIAALQRQGFSLAGIRRLLQAWETGRSLADLLGFERALTEPWSDEEPELLTVEELVRLFPEAASNPAHGLRSMELGLIEPAGDRVRVLHPRLLRIGAEMVAAGIPLDAVHDELAILRADLDAVAARFVGLFEDHIWRPFSEAGLPADRLPAVTEALRRLRPLVMAAVGAVLAGAMDRRAAASTAAHAADPQVRSATVGALAVAHP